MCNNNKQKKAAFPLALHNLEKAEIASDQEHGDEPLLNKLNEAKVVIETFEKKAAEGALMRSRANWQIYGEKPSKYFSNLEEHNAFQKYIPELKVKANNGT